MQRAKQKIREYKERMEVGRSLAGSATCSFLLFGRNVSLTPQHRRYGQRLVTTKRG